MTEAQEALEGAAADGGLVIAEDAVVKQRRFAAAEETFGVGEAPALPSVEFQVKGAVQLMGVSVSGISCTVRLEGANVSEGVRAMVEQGYATGTALPDHVTALPNLTAATVQVDGGAGAGPSVGASAAPLGYE